MGKRRQLSFDDWDTVLADLQQLAAGHVPHGKWDLEQTAKHLDDWLRFPMDGYPPSPLPLAPLMLVMRYTVGPVLLRKIIRERKMQDGVPTAPRTVHAKSADPAAAQAAVKQLQATIARFRQHQGPIHTSPVFGKMDRATAEQLHHVHCAHHLSWLQPQTPSSVADSTSDNAPDTP